MILHNQTIKEWMSNVEDI